MSATVGNYGWFEELMLARRGVPDAHRVGQSLRVRRNAGQSRHAQFPGLLGLRGRHGQCRGRRTTTTLFRRVRLAVIALSGKTAGIFRDVQPFSAGPGFPRGLVTRRLSRYRTTSELPDPLDEPIGATAFAPRKVRLHYACAAPELARVETTNILRRLERAKLITTPEANGAYEDFMQLEPELFSFEPFAHRVGEPVGATSGRLNDNDRKLRFDSGSCIPRRARSRCRPDRGY